ncbi:MAG: glutaredoxin 3 [Proteobacteria bacterium]|nr:glutaredoxin 3 [Pseudomonadota bacterium]
MSQPRVVIYTRGGCGYCTAALRLLDARGIAYEHIDASHRPDLRAKIAKESGQTTVPQIFIDGRSIGGYTELHALERAGGLDDVR